MLINIPEITDKIPDYKKERIIKKAWRKAVYSNPQYREHCINVKQWNEDFKRIFEEEITRRVIDELAKME